MYQLRVRTPKGIVNLPEFDEKKTTFRQLLEMICEMLPDAPQPHCLGIRAGFPPKEVIGKRDQSVGELIENRDTIVAFKKDANPQLLPQINQIDDPVSVPDLTGGDGNMVRRVVPSDNSCLFTSVSYVLERQNSRSVEELRRVISQELLSKPDDYSEAILGEDPIEYAKWFVF